MRFLSSEHLHFTATIKGLLLKILQEEVTSGGHVEKNYFSKNGNYYTINVYLFENDRESTEKTLGRFEFLNMSFVFWEKIVSAPVESIMDLLRHELAHFLTYIEYGSNVDAHGKEFHEICAQNGWGKVISSATVENGEFFKIENDQSGQKRKVKKLLELSQSSNVFEATLAMQKAQELSLKYQLELEDLETTKVYVQAVITAPRFSNLWNSYSHILAYFQVAPLICREHQGARLDLVGDKDNIINACLIFNYLDDAWKKAWSEQSSLKGKRSKNSFARGFLMMIEQGLDAKKKLAMISSSKEILRSDRKLREDLRFIYPKLRNSRDNYQTDGHAHYAGVKAGESAGKNLHGLRSHYHLTGE